MMTLKNIVSTLSALTVLCLFAAQPVFSQDTLSISLPEFIEQGISASGQVAYERGAADLARNRVDMAKAQRILPSINLNTQHGVVPGVVSQVPGLSEGEYYLDPNLENDWEDWAVFTRAELNAVQPIYSWGAINSAVKAAEEGAKAAEFQFDAVNAEAELQLFELYYSYLLAIEISRILEDANSQLEQVDETLKEMQEEGNPDLEEADIFKLDIFKTEFQTQRVEVQQSLDFVKRMWEYALQASQGTTYVPEERFLDPLPYELEDYTFYENSAFQSRSELKGVEAGIEALRNSVDATKAQQYPFLFLGITGSFALTPNRPRQTNPFIINNSNYGSAGFGLGIRQNLNFQSIRNRVERTEIEYQRVNDLHKAVTDGIVLEVNEKYREAVIADSKLKQTEEALKIARNWVRNEQLNYDLGFGDVENLLEAVQKELELRLNLKQNTFDLNKKVAALYKASGVTVSQMFTNE
jgi:outer membrane protein TolC